MAASSSIADADLMVVDDDLRLIALCHGTKQADATALVALSDEDYAAELQLQEVIVSSTTMAAAAAQSSSHTPQLDMAANKVAETPTTLAVVECSCSSSSPAPPAAAFTAGEDAGGEASICKICFDNVPPSDMHHASGGCAHAFCAACLTRYISAKIQDRISEVKCPEEDCESVLDPELVSCHGILPREAFEDWCAALCMSMVQHGESNVCYCPFNDCSEIMVDERAGQAQESECPVCRRMFCAQCGVPWHAGISCAEYEQLAPGDRGKEDLVVLEMAKGKKWRRCPRCKYLVDKHDGCVHITCRCGFQFCYGCGEQWAPSGHGSCHAL